MDHTIAAIASLIILGVAVAIFAKYISLFIHGNINMQSPRCMDDLHSLAEQNNRFKVKNIRKGALIVVVVGTALIIVLVVIRSMSDGA